MAARPKSAPVGVAPKSNASAVLASLGCCQPRSASARYASQQSAYEQPKKREGGDCSWCVEYTQHMHNHENDTWRCSVCMGPTAKCSKCKSFSRVEGRTRTCLKCAGGWDALTERKRVAFAAPRNPQTIRADLMRDSTFRQQAVSEGVIRPFLLLVSMSPSQRQILGVGLGWTTVTDGSFGDSHSEAWELLNKRFKGLRARCLRSAAKYNPFASGVGWYGMLLYLAQTMYVPSYMNWDDEFQTERLGSGESSSESCKLVSPKVEALEIELLEKVSKQHRSKMTRVQICTVAQLTTTDNVRALMQLLQSKGVDRQSILLFGIDTNFLMLFNACKIKRREGDDDGASGEVEADVLVAEVSHFISACPESTAALFEAANPAPIVCVPPESGVSAGMTPVWLMMELLGHTPGQGIGRLLPAFVQMLLQKERLKVIGVPLDSCDRR